jgi:hypothetical protein
MNKPRCVRVADYDAELSSGRKLNVHRIRSREVSPIAPAMAFPNVIPPIRQVLVKGFLRGLCSGSQSMEIP